MKFAKPSFAFFRIQFAKKMRKCDRWTPLMLRTKENIFERKKYFSIFLVKNAFLTKNYNFLEFLKICILSLGYQTFHTKKPFCDEMFLEISVRKNMYPIGQPTCSVLWQFLGVHVFGSMF